MNGYLSRNFSLVEMIASAVAVRKGFDNRPSLLVEANLTRLCREFLEELRTRFGPVRVSSGFRCPALNAMVGGSATSAHMDGRAADVLWHDPSVDLRAVVEWVANSSLLYDQVILEYGAWVHIGIAREGEPGRRQTLMAFRGTGYMPFDASRLV